MDQGEPLDRRSQAPFAGHGAQDQVRLVRPGGGEEVGKLADLDLVAGAAAGGVDQDDVHVAEFVDRAGHLTGGVRHGEGKINDLRIRSKLFDGRDPVGVHRHEARPEAVGELEIGGELGHGGRLADPRRADQGHHPARAGDGGDRRRDRHARLDRVAQRLADQCGTAQVARLQVLGDVAEQPPRQRLGNFSLQQLGIRRHKFARQVGEQVVDPPGPAQPFDQRVQSAQTLVELQMEGRRRRD